MEAGSSDAYKRNCASGINKMTAAERLKKVESTLAELNIRMSGVGGGGGGNHNLLSATHPDTDPDSPVRGDILRGIAGPEWQRYAIGAAGRFLRSDGNDPLWAVIQAGDLPAHAAEHEIGGGDLVDHDNLTNFVANEHIDHTAITLTAGTGLTGGGTIAANRTFDVDVGIADNKIAQIDGAPVANDYAKFTATGLVGRSYDEVLADLSGQALAAFDWNDQALTSIGATELYGDIKTDRWLLQDSNTFIGVGVAGAGNLAHSAGTEGWDNSFFGHTAGRDNTTGYANTFFGRKAGRDNTTGKRNSFFGMEAGMVNIGGEGNAFFGRTAGYFNTEGDHNSMFGHAAGYSNTTGSQNIFFGRGAGQYQSDGIARLETPENSVYIGAFAKSGSVPAGGEDNIINEIVIGYDAVGHGSNTITLGNTNIVTTILRGNVGIDVSTFGAGAVNVLAIPNGTPPDAAVADEIQIYSKDSSDGAANATLALMLEQAVEVIGTFTPSHKIKVWINAVEYWLQLDAV